MPQTFGHTTTIIVVFVRILQIRLRRGTRRTYLMAAGIAISVSLALFTRTLELYF